MSTPLIRKTDGKLCSNETETANVLAESFCNVFTTSNNRKFSYLLNYCAAETLADVKFSPELVKHYLQKKFNDTAPGPDKLSSYLLKTCAKEMSCPISNIFTFLFTSGLLPSQWLQATVSPIYKTGDKLIPNNFCPVSLTSLVCKTMEKIIAEKVILYLHSSAIFRKFQHGFLPGRSVVTNLLSCLNDWTKHLDLKNLWI